MPRQLTHQMHDVLAHQGLTTGQPELPDAFLDEDGAEPVKLLERQKILFRQESHVFSHAIGAAEVAAIRHRDAQIGDAAAERPALRAMLPDMRSLRVMDLGCGFGWFCRWAREHGAAEVLGIDVSENMLTRAKAMTQD